ncbi:DNA primase small subunit-like isoform X2 [Varroa jacobsoni]|uniref:DNA primase n=1 Tax=Varroa destructor TaxID=109461 RepID=A0A7M7J973_VARDE|nr:DNA primase small subunit-like isoform X2 [Varroa destructor]XP_022687575.1 DNA primase small subunit-like isoform X2 [Varroa jacobsoni]
MEAATETEVAIENKENNLEQAAVPTKKEQLVIDTCFTDALKIYYDRLFPVNLFYKWLSYGRDPAEGYFVNREFSFTLEGDIYLRYLSFKDNINFKADLIKNIPIKIDLGAVYDYINDKSSRKPREREYVLDIDMTDFDDVRSCCSATDICLRCWPFMTIAIRCLNAALTEDFGFRHLLWVYSGRRGIHCWVADRMSREMSSSCRGAVTNYLDVLTEVNPKRPKILFKMHPALERAAGIMRKYMDDMVVHKQKWADSTDWWTKVLKMCLDIDLRDNLEKRVLEAKDGITRWEVFKALADNRQSKKHPFYFEELLFHLLYPRLDVNVSMGLNHLLKAPFCLHPKTGRVCVPIDVDNVDEFDPFSVPTGSSLLAELDAYIRGETENLADFKKTSLKPYVEYFGSFVRRLLAKAPHRPEYDDLDF